MPEPEYVRDIFAQAPTNRGMPMVKVSELGQVVIALVLLILITSAGGHCAGQTDILVSQSPAKHEIRYVSGGTVYDEEFLNGRLIGRSWGTQGTKSAPKDVYKRQD